MKHLISLFLFFIFSISSFAQISINDPENFNQLVNKNWQYSTVELGKSSNIEDGFLSPNTKRKILEGFTLDNNEESYIFNSDYTGFSHIGGYVDSIYWTIKEDSTYMAVSREKGDFFWGKNYKLYSVSEDSLILYQSSSFDKLYIYYFFTAVEQFPSAAELFAEQASNNYYASEWNFDKILSDKRDYKYAKELAHKTKIAFERITFLPKSNQFTFDLLYPNSIKKKGVWEIQNDSTVIFKFDDNTELKATILFSTNLKMILGMENVITKEKIEHLFSYNTGETTIRPQLEFKKREILYYSSFLVYNKWKIKITNHSPTMPAIKENRFLEFDKFNQFFIKDQNDKVLEKGKFSLHFNRLKLTPENGKEYTFWVDTLDINKARLDFLDLDDISKSGQIQLQGTLPIHFTNNKDHPEYIGSWKIDEIIYRDIPFELSEQQKDYRKIWPAAMKSTMKDIEVNFSYGFLDDIEWEIDNYTETMFSGTCMTDKTGQYLYINDDATEQNYIIEAKIVNDRLHLFFVDLPEHDQWFYECDFVFKKID